MGIRVVRTDNTQPDFYCLVGPFLSRREVVKDVGGTIWDDDGKIWFVALDDALVALSAVRVQQDKAIFSSAYVRPDCRRQGIFAELVRQRLAFVQQHGVKSVEVMANAASRSLLERAGFVVVSTKGSFFKMMRKDVS